MRIRDWSSDVCSSDLNLIDSGIDLAIRVGSLTDSQLMARKLTEHRRIVCASPSYVAKHGAPAAPAELSTHQALRFTLVGDDRWLLRSEIGRASCGKEWVSTCRSRWSRYAQKKKTNS